jgi:hypothetical protein
MLFKLNRATRAVSISCAIIFCIFPLANLRAASTTQPTEAQMQQKLDALEARLNQLQSEQSQTTDARVAAQTISDANHHSMLLSDTPFFAGYDPDVGFSISSPDHSFSIHPGVLFQFRYVVNSRNSIPPYQNGGIGNGDDTEQGFEVSRARFILDGNVFSEYFTYFIQFGQDTGQSSFSLFDAYVLYRVGPQSPLAVKVGQFKDFAYHEKNLLPSRLLAVDRSLVDALIAGGQTDRIQGASILYDLDRTRAEAALDDGYNGRNEPFYGNTGGTGGPGAGAGTAPADWGASIRGEYLLVGTRDPAFNPYSEYDQFTSLGATRNVVIVGAGASYTESGANKIIFQTADIQYNSPSGFSAYAAYLGVYRNYNTNRGVAPGSYYDSGALIQAAYLVGKIEPFIRYDYTHLDGQADPGIVQDNVNEITVGANYYFAGQHAKFTIDGTWLPNGSPAPIPQLNILQDNGHNEFLLRAQFQLEF